MMMMSLGNTVVGWKFRHHRESAPFLIISIRVSYKTGRTYSYYKFKKKKKMMLTSIKRKTIIHGVFKNKFNNFISMNDPNVNFIDY